MESDQTDAYFSGLKFQVYSGNMKVAGRIKNRSYWYVSTNIRFRISEWFLFWLFVQICKWIPSIRKWINKDWLGYSSPHERKKSKQTRNNMILSKVFFSAIKCCHFCFPVQIELAKFSARVFFMYKQTLFFFIMSVFTFP